MNKSDIEKLKTCVFFIEATHFEQFTLWKQNNDNTWDNQIEWEQDLAGFGTTIGYINENKDLPVVVQFFFAKLNGHRVCFYEATSRYVDHTLVEQYIDKNFPVKWDNGTRRALTDANNFHHAIDCCRNYVEQPKVVVDTVVTDEKLHYEIPKNIL
jgi:hypothetical protein